MLAEIDGTWKHALDDAYPATVHEPPVPVLSVASDARIVDVPAYPKWSPASMMRPSVSAALYVRAEGIGEPRFSAATELILG